MPAVRAGLANLSTVGQSDAHVIDGSLRFDGPATDYLSRDFGAGNRRTYTISFWAKPSNHDEHGSVGTGGGQVFTAGTVGGGARATFGFSGVTNGANKDAFQLGHNATGSSWASLNSDSKFRDFSAWQHFVVSVDVTQNTASNRVKLYANGVEQPLTGTYPNDEDQPVNNNGIGHAIGRYNPEGTDYFDGYLSNFYFIDGQALSPSEFGFTDPLTNTWRPKKYQGAQAPNAIDKIFSANFAASDSFQATAPAINAFNGGFGTVDQGRAACSSSGCTITLSSIDVEVKSKLEIWSGYGSASVNGGTAVNYDGSAPGWQDLSFTGALSSIAITGASGLNAGELYAVRVDGVILVDGGGYGVNGFDLPFDGSAAIGTDQSGRGNDWTANNITDADVRSDSPSGCSFTSNLSSGISGITTSQAPTNYCTWNYLQNTSLTEGNLVTNGTGNFYSTIVIPKTGSWYWEVTANDSSYIGIDNRGQYGTKYIHYNKDGQKQITSGTTSAYGSSFTTNDLIGVAFNASNMTIRWYKNGADQGEVNVGSGGVVDLRDLDLQCQFYTDSTNESSTNFGQKAFRYTPPEGYQSLNLANLPTPDVVRPTQYVGVATYTGTGSAHYVNVGFAPDVVWIKRRNGANYHHLFNTVIGKDDVIFPNDSAIEDPFADFGPFNLNGYTISGTYNGANASGQTYVSWCWKAGGSKNTFNVDDVGYSSALFSGLVSGSITPTGASVGTKQGFSMIKYAGSTGDTTISHGLDKAPDFYMVKCLDVGAESWRAYHSSIGAEYALTPNDSAGESQSSIYFNDTEPTSTVFSVGSNYDGVNATGRNYMAFLWHDVPGLQKFGKYTANNDADGPYIELGFRPAIVIIKKSSDTGHWLMYDIERNHYNLTNNKLAVDLYQEENASEVGAGDLNGIDLLSNGFKCRTNTGSSNSTGTYLYMAWAYQPMNNLYGGQSNAR